MNLNTNVFGADIAVDNNADERSSTQETDMDLQSIPLSSPKIQEKHVQDDASLSAERKSNPKVNDHSPKLVVDATIHQKSGVELFGLNLPQVMELISDLPGFEEIKLY